MAEAMTTRCILYGASLTTANFIDTMKHNGQRDEFEIVAIVDDAAGAGPSYCGVPVVAGFTDEELPARLARDERVTHFAIVMANPAYMTMKWRVYQAALRAGLHAITMINRDTYVAEDAVLGAGTFILPHATVSTRSVLGDNCLLSPCVSIMEGCTIGDNVQFNGNTFIGGNARIDDNVWIGPGVTIAGGVHLGANTVIGAGATVLRDVPSRSFAAGSPVNLLRENTIYKSFI